jgi:AraC-like DNA-binding protein
VRYREYAPPASLAPAVACLWTLDGVGGGPGSADAQPVLPDGRAEVVIHFGDPFIRCDTGRPPVRQPAVLFAGQLDGPLPLCPGSRIATLGIRFRPYGAARALAVPQHELVGSTIDVESVAPPRLAAALLSIRDAAASPLDAIRWIERLVAPMLTSGGADRRVGAIVDAVERHGGRVSVDALATAAGISRRQLERLFLRDVGIAPKPFARIVRFQRALRLLEQDNSRSRGARVAQHGGYADQAHFIRDFRELAGCPPGEHLLRRAELTGLFTGLAR